MWREHFSRHALCRTPGGVRTPAPLSFARVQSLRCFAAFSVHLHSLSPHASNDWHWHQSVNIIGRDADSQNLQYTLWIARSRETSREFQGIFSKQGAMPSMSVSAFHFVHALTMKICWHFQTIDPWSSATIVMLATECYERSCDTVVLTLLDRTGFITNEISLLRPM